MIKSSAAIVTLLTGLNFLNYLDRQLIAAVLPHLQQDLRLNDTQGGWLGSAFLLGYMVTSPLFGWLGDRMSRKGLIALGVLVWCGATAGSGWMKTFAGMMVIRGMVGIGEASYAALSPTILDDVIPSSWKNRILAIFYAAIPVGSALGFVLGGVLDKHYGWRNAFFIAGGPGVLLAFACLLIVEPERKLRPEAMTTRGALDGLWSSERYVWAVLGFVAQTFALGGFSQWAPKLLHQKFHLELHTADFYFGVLVVTTGFGGTFLGGFWADRALGEDRTQVAIRVCALSTAAAVPVALLSLLAPPGAPWLFFGAMGLAQLGIFVSMSPFNTVVLGAVPPETRATAMAASIFAGHMLGDLISMPLVGYLSDRMGGNLAGAMLILPAALLVNAIAWFVSSRRPAHVG
ncbi:MAG: MFS transporter [Myxococcales bacterium]|nr:MFS transporter [Polyangiaceae bacterium]MDW8251695.1 MFS transporter [Myxococcales bacterium]